VIPETDFRDKGMDREVRRAAADMLAARDELLAAISEIGPADWERLVPYGARSLHDLLAHVAAADHTWAIAAGDLLKGEGEDRGRPATPDSTRSARERAIERGRRQTPDALLDEMARRRKLLLSLYELLAQRHLARALAAFGDRHNSVRERIWVGYHDRMHAADIRRALSMRWHPPRLRFLPELRPGLDALAPDETLYVIYSVDPMLWERASPLPGWSYRALLSHIATGDWVLQHHLRHIIEHGSVTEWPDIDAGNAARIAERRFSTVTALVEEYLSMRHETRLVLSRLKQKHLALPITLWFETPPADRTVLDYLLGFERHEARHRDQLRTAMKYVH
jgi:hypothetical protein